MFDRDEVDAPAPIDGAITPTLIRLWGQDHEVIATINCPKIPAEFVTADGRLNLENYTAAFSD